MTENGKSGYPKNQNRYRYDVYGRLLTRTDGSGTVQEENRYLPDGRLAFSREADGQEIRYAYGAHGREEETSTARSRKAGRAAQKYRYDSRGRITGVVKATAMRRAMTWTHGDASKTSARQTAGRKAIPMTLRAMSPVPGMPTAA